MEPGNDEISTRTEPSLLANDAIKELSSLLKNPEWQSIYVEQATQAESEKIKALEAQISKDAKKTAGQKLGEQLGVTKPTPEDYKTKLPPLVEVELARLRLENDVEFQTLNSELMKAGEETRKGLTELATDLEHRKNDPELVAAFETWGRCPNHAGDRGKDGKGYNAGVIHYFEYRPFKDKKEHNDGSMTLDGFIDWSKRLGKIVLNSDTGDLKKVVKLEDSSGKQALYELTNDDLYIISYAEPGDHFKIVTAIPGQSESALQKSVETEMQTPLADKQMKRLNYLGEGVHQI